MENEKITFNETLGLAGLSHEANATLPNEICWAKRVGSRVEYQGHFDSPDTVWGGDLTAGEWLPCHQSGGRTYIGAAN